jgi:hypothetical protein
VQQLSADQRQAYDHIMQPQDIAVVQGYAGAGKSFMLGAAREAWEAEGYHVLGGALAGKAAEGLQISAGIESRSLHAWEYAWSQGRDRLTARDVLVIDEAGMVGSRQLGRVLEQAREAGAKVVLVGDTRQLQAIEAGAPMRLVGERVGQVTMQDIRRQRADWQREASKDLAHGEVDHALDIYSYAGCVHAHGSKDEARQAVVDAWAAHRHERPAESQIMLAYLRADVRQLNELARQTRRDAGELGADCRIETADGPRDFAKGDRIYFGKNDRQLGVMNGSLGTIEEGWGRGQNAEMQIRLDDGRRVVVDTSQYNHLDHGYAATAHKAQGVTVDRAHVLADSHFDQHVAYVALSRHRDRVDLHWSRDEFKDERAMRQCLGRERLKDVAVDYERVEQQARQLDQKLNTKAKEGPSHDEHQRSDESAGVEAQRAERAPLGQGGPAEGRVDLRGRGDLQGGRGPAGGGDRAPLSRGGGSTMEGPARAGHPAAGDKHEAIDRAVAPAKQVKVQELAPAPVERQVSPDARAKAKARQAEIGRYLDLRHNAKQRAGEVGKYMGAHVDKAIERKEAARLAKRERELRLARGRDDDSGLNRGRGGPSR